jgi:hypothetical protein
VNLKPFRIGDPESLEAVSAFVTLASQGIECLEPDGAAALLGLLSEVPGLFMSNPLGLVGSVKRVQKIKSGLWEEAKRSIYQLHVIAPFLDRNQVYDPICGYQMFAGKARVMAELNYAICRGFTPQEWVYDVIDPYIQKRPQDWIVPSFPVIYPLGGLPAIAAASVPAPVAVPEPVAATPIPYPAPPPARVGSSTLAALQELAAKKPEAVQPTLAEQPQVISAQPVDPVEEMEAEMKEPDLYSDRPVPSLSLQSPTKFLSVASVVQADPVPLALVHGPSGAGKTRFSARVAGDFLEAWVEADGDLPASVCVVTLEDGAPYPSGCDIVRVKGDQVQNPVTLLAYRARVREGVPTLLIVDDLAEVIRCGAILDLVKDVVVSTSSRTGGNHGLLVATTTIPHGSVVSLRSLPYYALINTDDHNVALLKQAQNKSLAPASKIPDGLGGRIVGHKGEWYALCDGEPPIAKAQSNQQITIDW